MFRRIIIFSVGGIGIVGSNTYCDGRKYTGERLHKNDNKVNITKNVKVIHFVRHAQGDHNVAGEQDRFYGYLREDLEDANLTTTGIIQCKKLSEKAKHVVSNSQLLLVSPMNRTIQTAKYSFPYLLTKESKIKWLALESIREQTGLHPCDRRKSISEHKLIYNYIDFSFIENDKDPLYHLYTQREPNHKVVERGNEFMKWLSDQTEDDIIVVTHSAFLRHLFNEVIQVDERDKAHFENCEMRSFRITFS
eukprot:gene5051-7049_t